MKLHIGASVALSVLTLAGTAQAHMEDGSSYPGYNFLETPVRTESRPVSHGFQFTMENPLSLSWLGYWDDAGDGFATSHEVAIWDITELPPDRPPDFDYTPFIIASATLPAGQSGILDSFFGSRMPPSGFRYGRVNGGQAGLHPMRTYVIAGFSPSDADPFVYGGPSDTFGLGFGQGMSPGEMFARQRFGSPGLDLPFDTEGDLQFYAVNFAGQVPEPASWAMFILGFGLIGHRLRSRCAPANATISQPAFQLPD